MLDTAEQQRSDSTPSWPLLSGEAEASGLADTGYC